MERIENNIELFDRFVSGNLTYDELKEFEVRLQTDSDFATDFRIFAFVFQGICQETEQDNLDFGHAMKGISQEELLKIIGRESGHRPGRVMRRIHERFAWAVSVAAVVIIGITSVFTVHRAGMNKVDDLIVEYNYIPSVDRSGESYVRGGQDITAEDIPAFKKAYLEAEADDIQAQQDAGMRLAMAYLKIHDRKNAKATLVELSTRFADDELFAAKCREILDQLK